MEVIGFTNYLSVKDLRCKLLALLRNKNYSYSTFKDHISILDNQYLSSFDVYIVSPSQIILHIVVVRDEKALQNLMKIMKEVGS